MFYLLQYQQTSRTSDKKNTRTYLILRERLYYIIKIIHNIRELYYVIKFISCAHKTGRKRIRILLEYNGRAFYTYEVSSIYVLFLDLWRRCIYYIGTFI